MARVYADKLTAILGKTVLVDNRAGAATTVASNSVAKAAPDGYTIYAGGTSLIINPTLTGNVQYDPHKSFDLVSLMSFTPFILHVNADFPPKNMAGADRLPEGQSRQVQHGELGRRRDQPHGGRAVQGATGLKYTIVPYRGGAQAGQDLAAGNAQMMFSASLEAKPLLDGKKTRAIAISSLTRSPAFPDIPTVAGVADLPDFQAIFWQAHGGAGRHAQADRRQAAGRDRQGRRRSRGDRAVQDPGRRDQELDPAELKAFYLKEEKIWTTLIKEQGIKAE